MTFVATEHARFGHGVGFASNYYVEPAVRVALFGPRGGHVGGVEVTPLHARALAAELLRAADEAEDRKGGE